MPPRLTVLSGPWKNTSFAVVAPLSIGSDSSNSICLEDPAVALQHSCISEAAGCFTIRDLDSPAGTFVNGIPITERVLSFGDQISVGDSSFLFLPEAAASAESRSVELDDQAALSLSAQQLKPEDLLYLRPESLAALPPAVRLARTLSTLLKISSAIGFMRDIDALQWQLLALLFDVIPAERGVILLLDCSTGEFSAPVAWDRAAGPDHPVHLSRVLAQRVVEERVAVLDHEPPRVASSNSANAAPASGLSLLCVPLTTPTQSLGLIYLDTRNPATRFSNDDLQLLSAIAGLASVAVENARQFESLGSENQRLRAEFQLQHDMIGRGPRMRQVYQFIERVAPSDSTVLILGESGTGKELASRAIHLNSPRKSRPFVALNCAALTETLLESELFGHERGAFTSAVSQKKGLLEVAEGGTVFLDEVAELPHALQAKLLRVLQEREFVRLGGTFSIKLNVRFIAATNKDLQKAVTDEKFRLDLFYRLNVVSISMPALREHPEDIPFLTDHFVTRYSARSNRKVLGLSPAARACLAQYDWPGNIRELENAIERAIVIGNSDVILPEDLPDALADRALPASESATKFHDAVRESKKHLILTALEQSQGSFTQAAKLLGLHPNYLHRLVSNLDLKSTLKSAAKH
ncbi:MAG TPA: sigma 54-interacting transcriptional regulator [Candidatus Limnocylindrales bacterium]|nr:sigma 54-interacting transcriptional regulator [Candidatus Limnocylindrales bacterium]